MTLIQVLDVPVGYVLLHSPWPLSRNETSGSLNSFSAKFSLLIMYIFHCYLSHYLTIYSLVNSQVSSDKFATGHLRISGTDGGLAWLETATMTSEIQKSFCQLKMYGAN